MRKTVLFLAGVMWALGAYAYPNPPLINVTNIVNVTTFTNAPYAAVGDGVTDNTAAINSAIVRAAALPTVNGLGGGTVEFPGPGVYLCNPITMKSKVNFQLDAGAILRLQPRGTYTPVSDFMTLSGLSDIEISGPGAIDGQGAAWWANQTGALYLISFSSGCKRVLIQDITISNSPAQNIVFKGSGGGDILIQRISIFAPSSHAGTPSHNTDGIDLIGTNDVVRDCVISTGDDNIAIGSSSSGAISANITVSNVLFGVGHGMTIGSNTEGGVSNLTVLDCIFTNTDYGIKMKSDNASSGEAGKVAWCRISPTTIWG